MALKPEAFQQCFQDWIAAAIQVEDTQTKRLVAMDGKTCRGSQDAGQNLGSLHIVSAGASEEGMALGQVATDENSNEITAIPQLLKPIALTNTIVTMDAMGCQKEMAQDIVQGGGDFVLAVKDNPPRLREAIENHFVDRLDCEVESLRYRMVETTESGHGRIDERSYCVTRIPKAWSMKSEWPWVQAMGYSVRITRHADGRVTDEVRYSILSQYLSGERFREAVRGHGSIESMHWVLDVTFREDDSRTRERTLGDNLSWLRRFAVTLLKRHPVQDSIRGKMLRCQMSTDFLAKVLTFQED